MHRIVNKTPEEMSTDHVNKNKLDNRKCNLRTCTDSENMRNSKMHITNTSGYKGVYWDNSHKRWVARIGIRSKIIRLGRYKTKQEAAFIRKQAEEKLNYT